MIKISEARVLIISSTIKDINTISIALQSLGVAEHNIQSTHNFKLALRRITQPAFDIYVMDYDQSEVREEFYHTAQQTGFMSDVSVKIFITSDKKSLYGIMDLEPDGFLMRPFSASKMKAKISTVCEEKNKLSSLLVLANEPNQNKLLSACNLSEIYHPKFYYQIMETRGRVFENMGEQEVVLNLYESMIKRIDNKVSHPWLYARYLKSLIQAKKIKKADTIRKHILANKVRMSPELYDTIIDLDICIGDIENAQSVSESLCALTPANFERKAVLSTLYLIQGEYFKAMKLNNESYQTNKDGYLDKPLNLLDYLKSILYVAQQDEESRHLYLTKFDLQIKFFKYKKLSDNDKWRLELLQMHKRLLEGHTGEAAKKLSAMKSNLGQMTLKTLHHYLTLIGLLEIEADLDDVYELALKKFREGETNSLARAQIYLIDGTFRSFKQAS